MLYNFYKIIIQLKNNQWLGVKEPIGYGYKGLAEPARASTSPHATSHVRFSSAPIIKYEEKNPLRMH